ncbi:MAG: protein kinase [Acidobacteria bacterium]|nr:protein kinase [Acidobacteriota bacterium]
MILCSNCDTINFEGNIYCNECGSRLPDAPQSTLESLVTNAPPSSSIVPMTTASLPPIENKLVFAPRRKKMLAKPRTRVQAKPQRSFRNKFNQFRDNFWRFRREIPTEPPPFPFTRDPAKYEAAIPLINSFRYQHEPIGLNGAARFVGRQNEIDALAERILFSDGGSILVTGYRGVGKTSFIHQVVRKLKEALPWAQGLLGEMKIVDIYINLSRPVQPGQLMHHIIRRLHDRLVEKQLFQLLDPDLKKSLTQVYRRTSGNTTRGRGDTKEARVKGSVVPKHGSLQNFKMAMLGYDDKAAEDEVIAIMRRLNKGYSKPRTEWQRWKGMFRRLPNPRIRLKIVFVLDELDKLEEFTMDDGKNNGEQKPIIDLILGALKNLFTTSGATFLFVAGKDIQERWLEDAGSGESLYESVFSYDQYLACMWESVDSICDELFDQSREMTPQDVQVMGDFKKFLAYKGRGVPRRIIRILNEYVEWNDDYPRLVFNRRQVRRFRFFAGLQTHLQENEKIIFGVFHEAYPETQSDKRRIGIYTLVDWVLRQGTEEFSLTDLLNLSRRLNMWITPQAVERLITVLADKNYLEEVQKPLNQVFIGDPEIGEEKKYKLAARRLVEMGGSVHERKNGERDFTDGERMLSSIGKYKVIKQIGKGGMGQVYHATDELTGRMVAVKVLAERLGKDSEIAARFEREAMVMSSLRHPNVVQFYDWGKAAGRHYIAMEYIDGLTLDELIYSRGKLSLDRSLAIAIQVAETAHFIHQKGFVRNDIKPSNIMLTSAGKICMLDFGITKSADPSRRDTQTGIIVGTPLFMAPEQFERHSVDVRSDVYSLGMVLYQMLTGVYPFVSADLPGIVQAHLHQVPPPPSSHSSLLRNVDQVVLKCLEKDPDDRYQSMEKLNEALKSIAGDLSQVDLRSLVKVVSEEVKEIGKREGVPTLIPPTGRQGAGSLRETVNKKTGALQAEINAIDSEVEVIWLKTTPPELSEVAEPPASPSIVLLNQSTATRPYYLSEGSNTFGRSIDNDILLPDLKVSRHHGAFIIEQTNCLVEDFNSLGGTLVNGERVITARLLRHDDQIKIGDLVFAYKQPGVRY